MTNTISKAQEKIISIVKTYCPTTEVIETDYGVVWVRWTNNADNWLYVQSFMASIGPRGGFKIVTASCPLDFDHDKKHQRTMAYNSLSAIGRASNLGRLRGTIAIR